MAKIIRRSVSLSKKYRQYKRKTGILCVLGILYLVMAPICCYHIDLQSVRAGFIFSLVVIPPLVSSGNFIAAAVFARKAKIVKVGIEGEHTTAEVISMFPKEYYGLQNVNVTFDGKTSELDMVVIGPTGIFVIETKNMNGMIEGYYEDTYWTQTKIGRGGTPYSNTFYSPIKQVGTHVYRLANKLKRKGVKIHVCALVYFANSETVLQMQGEYGHIPVYSCQDDGIVKMHQYITGRERILSNQEVRRLCKLLS